ncbi:hypothetical protein TNCV_571401 [Trichonephila clavipes]|nr:hypothetical protein TNCV_571401 [Trichonephila clavipes]
MESYIPFTTCRKKQIQQKKSMTAPCSPQTKANFPTTPTGGRLRLDRFKVQHHSSLHGRSSRQVEVQGSTS